MLVSITRKLRIARPLFAVTIEQQGGGIVSKRERGVTLAAVKG